MFGWRHWFKREVVIPAGMLALTGFGLAWLAQQLMPLLRQEDFRWLLYTFLVCVGVYVLFAYVTMRHILSTYTLERFDPGEPESVRRLSQMTRFNCPGPGLDPGSFTPVLLASLESAGFSVEANHPVVGKVLIRQSPPRIPLLFRSRRERIFIVEKTPLNVFIVDFTLRDTLRFLADQKDQPSDPNLLVFVTEEPQVLEAASAAAGVVNFLGKTEEGTLGTFLFDACGNRMYYPIDQTLIPFRQRFYFRKIRRQLLTAIQAAASKPAGARQ